MKRPGGSKGSRSLRVLLISAGISATVLGVLGIFLPLLPTVPLLLLAAACFARSSERFYRWLLGHRHLGPMISDYLDGEGIPLRAKISAIALIWATIPVTAVFFVSLLWVRILLFAVGVCITLYLLRLPLRRETVKSSG